MHRNYLYYGFLNFWMFEMNLSLNDIFNRYKDFQDGVRVSMLINRGIGNSNKGSKRWMNKIISTNPKEWQDAITTLHEIQLIQNNPDMRIYSCLNDRDMAKGIKMFQHMLIDVFPDMRDRFYRKLNDRFCSALMKPENKNSKLFMLDVDSKVTHEVDEFISSNMIEVVNTFPSRQGWHYIVKPFNVTLANGKETFSVIKDGLILINYLDGQNEHRQI